MTLRALIFDLDGVIVDTNTPHYLSWLRLSQELGLPFAWEQFESMKGLSRSDSLRVFLNGVTFSESAMQAMLTRKNAHYLELLESMTPAAILPGIHAMIAAGRAAGLKIALASSSRNARHVLGRLDLLDAFEVIGDGLTVPALKPAPDLFLWTIAQLGVSATECVIFEDAQAGVDAARAAGVAVLAIATAPLNGATAQVTTLDGVTLDWVREHLTP